MFAGLSSTPRVGLEPTTPRLTAACSTSAAVTYRKISLVECHVPNYIQGYLILYFQYFSSFLPLYEHKQP